MDQDDDAAAYRVVGRENPYSLIAGRMVRRAWNDSPPSLMIPPRTVIDTVEHVLRARGRRRVMVRWTTQTLASVTVAGVVAAGLILILPRRPVMSSHQHDQSLRAEASAEAAAKDHQAHVPSPSLGNDPRALFVVAGRAEGPVRPSPQGPLAAGAGLVAPETGPVRIASAEGTELTLEPGGSLMVAEAGATERFALMRGAVQAHVKKLLVGQRFIVQTADAEIEVHGTRFRVVSGATAIPCAGTTTRVSVTEGVVAVRWSGHEERLFPGDDWPSKCGVASVRGNADASDGVRGPKLRSSHKSRLAAAQSLSGRASDSVAVGSQASPMAPASVLAAQNDLFTAAVRAKRAGRGLDAVNLFERFVQDYPNSPLVESALVQRMRLLARQDRQVASRAAAAYLARFPDGFARGEAHTLVTVTARL